MPVISAGQLTTLRTKPHSAKYYLSISEPPYMLLCRVNGTFLRGAQSVAYDTGQLVGSAVFGEIEGGLVLRVKLSTGVEYVRLRSISGAAASGTFTLAPNAIAWEDNAIVRVVQNYEDDVYVSRFGTAIGFKKDFDQDYPWDGPDPPVVIAGPHRPLMDTLPIDLAVDASNSYAVRPGATISQYSLSALPASGASVSFNTGTGTGTVTFSAYGQYWLKYGVQDSNGLWQYSYRRVWVHDPDPESTNHPYTEFTGGSLTGAYERGGWQLQLDVQTGTPPGSDVDYNNILVCFWCVQDYGGTAGPLLTDGDILFNGYIREGSLQYDSQSETLSFTAATVEALLDEHFTWSVSVEGVDVPTEWFEYTRTAMTTTRAVAFTLRYHSNIFSVTDVYLNLANDTLFWRWFDLPQGALWQVCNQALKDRLGTSLVTDKQGRMRVTRDVQLLDDTTRGGLATVVTLDRDQDDWREGATVTERKPVHPFALIEAFAYDGAEVDTYCAKSPGEVFGRRGTSPAHITKRLVADQDGANALAGRYYAAGNLRYREFRLTLAGAWYEATEITDELFWVVAEVNEVFWLAQTTTLGGEGVEYWVNKNLILRSVTVSPDFATGAVTVAVAFEPEATGPVGVAIDCVSGIPDPQPPEPPPYADIPGTLGAIITSTSGTSVYYRDDRASDWTQQDANAYTGLIIDPYYPLEQLNANPTSAIVWLTTTNAVSRSLAAGASPGDITPIIDPPNTWSSSPAPTVADLTFLTPHADDWVQGRFFVLAEWQEISDWRGWLGYTTAAGRRWAWVDLTGGVGYTSFRPLRMAVNDTYILVTVWADDNLRLQIFDAGDYSYIGTEELGSATITELNDRTRWAFPVVPKDGSADLSFETFWWVAGNMSSPQGLTGIQHIIKTEDAGVTAFVAEANSVDDDYYVTALIVGEDDGGSRMLYATTNGSVA